MSTIATTPPTTPPGAPGWIPPRLCRMTVDEYERMATSGILPSSSRFHLINGYVVEKLTQRPPHTVAVNLTRDELNRVKPAGWHLRSDQPIRLPGQASEPEPDHCLVRGAPRDYRAGHPGPADVALAVEVADSSLAEDRDYAARLYAPSGIPICWIVDVNGRRVEVYTGPGPNGYSSREVFTEAQSIPVVIDGREVGRIPVADLLP